MGKAGGIIVALIIAAVVITMKFQNQGDTSGEVRAEVIQILESFPNWESHQGLYVELLDANHDRIFDKHYRMGGKRTSAKFDGDAYWTDLFGVMAEGAKSRGYEDCASFLAQARDFDE